MNGKESMCEKLTKEQMAEHLAFAFCPKEFGFETEYSSNEEKFRDVIKFADQDLERIRKESQK